ncbi:tRNA (adenine(22)-N(1))-methyltransferase [Paenibacillus nasutitermitis]|uniref:tRNA (Adenine(22)-N(1))-methyltransferase n=1 Tax=Paenibacillus nasutitermitis TaxID=1652958 RepID=A0A916Z165_9BACL|nr:class I SAM-dependent methyltransferase [Paenibacillus nasutitermitis]GGD71323.1 tRNA (adenine(22)-N(1))-methyltransferase [Paenibacillus nasutitermitis]
MIKISKRLQTIADFVRAGARAADIGSDHALLPVYLVQSGKCPTAIAGELNIGPFQAARKGAAEAGLTALIDVRQGDGLSVLSPGEADTVILAGMGGSLMTDILEAGWAAGRLNGVSELVLQPNVGEDHVRRWLVSRDYVLQEETIIEEDGRIYEVLHALVCGDQQEAQACNSRLYNVSSLPLKMPDASRKEWLFRMGPYLLHNGEELLRKKWRMELDKLERVRRQLSLSALDESRDKQAVLAGEMQQIEEVLECLPMVKPSYK